MSEDDKTRILSGRVDDDKTRILSSRDLDDARTRVLKAADLVRAAAQSEDDIETRVLGREAAEAAVGQPAGLVVAPRGTPGDRIVFLCPNGHRIVVGKQFAGKRGKCNKCGVNVQIPRASNEPRSDPFAAIVAAPPEFPVEFALPGEAPANEREESPSVEGLPFGNLGEADSGSGEDGAGVTAASGGEGGEVNWNFESGGGQQETAEEEDSPWGETEARPTFDTGTGNPTARLVAKLWMEREHGGIIELHLVGGGVLLPQWYDSNWSRGTHGLFASPAPDGSVTITAVAWENVEKVIVRQLAAVPDDMFA